MENYSRVVGLNGQMMNTTAIRKGVYLAFNNVKVFGCVNTTVWMHHMDADKTHREKARWKLHKNATSGFEQIL